MNGTEKNRHNILAINIAKNLKPQEKRNVCGGESLMPGAPGSGERDAARCYFYCTVDAYKWHNNEGIPRSKRTIDCPVLKERRFDKKKNAFLFLLRGIRQESKTVSGVASRETEVNNSSDSRSHIHLHGTANSTRALLKKNIHL